MRAKRVRRAVLGIAGLVVGAAAAWGQPSAAAVSVMDGVAQTIAAGAAPGRIRDGGLLRVPFGYETPEVVCAPLRVCALLLEQGEAPRSTLVGDSVRWEVVAEPGSGLVAVRPKVCDIATNLLVVTDRRVYQVGLRSLPCPRGPENAEGEVTPLLGFYYPDELVKTWARSTAAPTRSPGVEALHFGYRLAPGKNGIRPLRVYDDGTETYIYLGKLRGGQDFPVAYEVGPEGKAGPVDQRTEGVVLVVGKVSRRLVLVSGAGAEDRTVIERTEGEDQGGRP